jgi:small conductance mechanosensitive channel
MNEFWQFFQTTAQTVAHPVAAILIILVVGWLCSRYLISPFQAVLQRLGLAAVSVSFLINTIRVLLLVTVFLAILQQLGVVTTSLIALLGAGGAALVISLNNTMANFAAGLILLGNRMVRLGDTIEVGDVRGQVVELLPFHVVVRTGDHVQITLPNSLLINGPLRNHTALPTRRVQWSLPIPPSLDLAVVRETLRARLRADDRILAEPAPALFVQDWSPERRLVVVQAWTATANAAAVQEQMLEELGKVVQENTPLAPQPNPHP